MHFDYLASAHLHFMTNKIINSYKIIQVLKDVVTMLPSMVPHSSKF